MNRRTLVKGAAIGTAAAAVPAAAARAAQRGADTRVDVAVVGSGLSGLYAAEQLRKGARSVVVLEGNDRVGGRILNLSVGPGRNDVTEGGGEWIDPKSPHVARLIKRFGLRTFKNYAKGQSTLILDGNVTHYSGLVPPLPAKAKQQVLAAIFRLTAMANSVPVDAPWMTPHAENLDAQSAETWIDDNMTDPIARDFLRTIMGGAGSWSPADISLLHYLFVAAANGGPLNLVTLGKGALSDRIVGGTGQLVQGLAAPLQNVTELNTPVTTIEHGAKTVRLTTPNGNWVADDVVIAMSPTMTQQILFDPVLPVSRTQAVQRVGNGSAIKAYPIYDKPFWRDRGLNAVVQSNSSPFSTVFDNSPPAGSPGVPLALVESKNARRLGRMSLNDRKAEILNALAVAFGEKARHPIGYVEHDWSKEPWIRGGAASFNPPGLLTEYRSLLGTQIGRIHFGGTETGTTFWGTMESALATGERAANEILAG